MVVLVLSCLLCLVYLHDRRNEQEVYVEAAAGYNGKRVALTFDDGPHATYTKVLLGGLKERNVRATFFLVGENIKGNEDIVNMMKEDGHLIGNHTYSHVILNEVSWDAALLEINKTNEIIKEVVGVLPAYIRPPYGGWSEDMLYEVNLTPVFWNVDPMDWNSSDVGEIVKSVVDNVKDGDIILMHDIFDSSVAAALEIVDELQKQGFMFVTVEEILIS